MDHVEAMARYLCLTDARSPEGALEYLAANADRLCKVRFTGRPYLALKAHTFYATLPVEDGNDFRDYLLAEVRAYAGQFGEPGKACERPEITKALAEIMEDTK